MRSVNGHGLAECRGGVNVVLALQPGGDVLDREAHGVSEDGES
jgi:hypothetical protein